MDTTEFVQPLSRDQRVAIFQYLQQLWPDIYPHSLLLSLFILVRSWEVAQICPSYRPFFDWFHAFLPVPEQDIEELTGWIYDFMALSPTYKLLQPYVPLFSLGIPSDLSEVAGYL